jgi:hypothetical protein
MEGYRSVWAERLDRMQSYVEQLHAEAERGSKKRKRALSKSAVKARR